ncbi:hypothetical protein EYE40_01960 [Glaciihabitans arcticus]|uniref:Alpha-galactosidase NEW3 domain-containing protein n=1 Tax=Glaciihabitans arcticus TaxID=2668039 RepID=A0A4Q9GT36_9MICO|nr:hypothetical protein [Glaciihabitans arcticus]TBN56257.1 hypothetical protein EYE40_01960 [Glaciihabitans arcticus]
MRRALVVILSLLVLAGCAPASAGLPDGVEVSVLQNRSDYASRTLEISIFNGEDAPLTLTRATFTSPRFAAPAEWSRGTELRAGATVNLRVTLPASVCAPQHDADPRVTVEFAIGSMRGTASVTPVDPLDRLATIAREDCLGQAVDDVAPIVAAPTLEWSRGAHEPASLDLVSSPTGAEGELEIVAVDRTVLLSVVDDAGEPIESVAVGVRVTSPTTVTLRFVPSRCDPHAVAEDKRGTFFPVRVRVAEIEGLVYVPVSDEVRVAIYRWIADYCDY